jgi:hypothetical protein
MDSPYFDETEGNFLTFLDQWSDSRWSGVEDVVAKQGQQMKYYGF